MIPKDAMNISVFKDGDAFCAVYTDTFEDLMVSTCGFGYTDLDAIIQLLAPNTYIGP
jgi:hypothetical protein